MFNSFHIQNDCCNLNDANNSGNTMSISNKILFTNQNITTCMRNKPITCKENGEKLSYKYSQVCSSMLLYPENLW